MLYSFLKHFIWSTKFFSVCPTSFSTIFSSFYHIHVFIYRIFVPRLVNTRVSSTQTFSLSLSLSPSSTVTESQSARTPTIIVWTKLNVDRGTILMTLEEVVCVCVCVLCACVCVYVCVCD